jgi:inosose dehydratase
MEIPRLKILFGSSKKFTEFLQERGIEKVVGGFTGGMTAHDRSTHDAFYHQCEKDCKALSELDSEMLISMPMGSYWMIEPITDEKIKNAADLWNRVGKMSLEEYGISVTCHHEFWCGIPSREELDKFYSWTDPEYVHLYIDTAQTTISERDPVKLYLKYHDRCLGFHFKDTHNIDNRNEYRTPPNPEMIAPYTHRWFWEMGTPEGLVDFPRLMQALKEYNYKGWISVEHDKAEVGGLSGGSVLRGDYAESTCVAKWYIDNVLSEIYK